MLSRRLVLAGTAALLAPSWASAQGTPSEFFVESDGARLFGRLYAPPSRARYPVIVIVFGAGIESELDAVYTQALVSAFTSAGIGVLAYDKRGVGRSSGAYTGSDFAALGEDAAAVADYARAQAAVSGVGIWGSSQAGWSTPYTVARAPWLRCAILVSPAGVNPFEQVTHFLHVQTRSWGLNEAEAEAAEQMHRAVSLYYAGRASYGSAQRVVDRYRNERWFNGVITHPYWDEMSAGGKILTPPQLREALAERPNAFEIYSSDSSFVDYRRHYQRLRRLPTLIIHGEDDELLSVGASRSMFEEVLGRSDQHDIWTFPNTGHGVTDAEGAPPPDYLSRMTEWAVRHLTE